MSDTWRAGPTGFAEVNGDRLAYREHGERAGVPLVMLSRFRASIDDWDPAVVERLAAERHVILFDNAGIGYSSGTVQDSITKMAETAAAFIESLGLGQVDLLGFSMGGYVAQRLTLSRPDLVRNLLLVGTAPGGGEGATYPSVDISRWVAQDETTVEALQALFFSPSPAGAAAAQGHYDRTFAVPRSLESFVPLDVAALQRAAIQGWWTSDSVLAEADKIVQPTLIVNGSDDVMVPTSNAFLLAQRLPNAELIIYPDSGHASFYQYPDTFAQHALQFLNAQDQGGLR
ncbi:alpha/beta fold hydrolase [Streptomyces sp. NPDC003442]